MPFLWHTVSSGPSELRIDIIDWFLSVYQRWLRTCEAVERSSKWCWKETGLCWPAWLEAAGPCSTAGPLTTATSQTGRRSTGWFSPTAAESLGPLRFPPAVARSTPDRHLEGAPAHVCYLQVFPALLVLTLLDSIQSLLTKLPQSQSLGPLEPKRDLFGSHFFPSPLSELSGSSERRCEGGHAADCHWLISCTL